MEPSSIPTPYAHGRLPVGDGHELYWECCGNPSGRPILLLHGGPGSGCSRRARSLFDPVSYNAILFDQRGCGRSTPFAGEDQAGLSANTTLHLLADIERLRVHLGHERWLILAGSWGSTLAIAYAERHPGRVAGMILRGTALTTPGEIEWVTHGARRLLPEAWERFRIAAEGAGESEERLVHAYRRLLADPDPAVTAKAASDWCAWEEALLAVQPDHRPDPRWLDGRFRLCFARLVTHYWANAAWLEDGALLRDAGRLAGIPGVLIHGRLDIASPLRSAWLLSRNWPGSELVLVGGAGHDTRDAGIGAATAAALGRFA